MKIQFFYKIDGADAPKEFDLFVRADGSVWRDSYQTFESQSSVIGFEDCIMECPDIGWQVIDE